MGVNDTLLLAMVTELPTPKFYTTVPDPLVYLNVILPLPAFILSVKVIPNPTSNS